ncbi:hypothetical protein Hoch_0398 [Haliangium ochraceum DSM 14365]|uniref:Immunity MXAN-0049 protein domain-containing protein n=2 Tax=Haliangium ochraceum TaxID=80816 RepID=D0LJ10_HALO1|nr:hypothetical protein Hoch_0398 [Haliangium ochraceum DSM 14365]
MTRDNRILDLSWDFDRINARNTKDAWLKKFPGWEEVTGLIGTRPLDVPNPILFEADFSVTPDLDFPFTDHAWPIMSRRMLDVLLSVGEFPHRCYPVRFVNNMAFADKRYLPDGSLRPEVVDDRFAAVQLTEYVDAVDWNASEYEREDIGIIEWITFAKLVLREPPGGFPPLFRIREKASMLLVSAEARRALEAAGIRGIAFDPLPGTSGPPQRD